MKKIRSAIVGLGRIGSTLEDDTLREKPCTHAGVIDRNPECVLVGGCDLLEKKRIQFSRRWNCPSVFSTVEDMLETTKPDILHIATPPDTHKRMVEAALLWGVKCAICEKPLSDNRRDAYKIARIHRTSTMKILTNHERRYSADYLQTKKIIENERYGRLLSINAKLSMQGTQRIRSVLWNDGTHLVDIIQFITSSSLRKEMIHGDLDSDRGTVFILCRAGTIPVTIEAGTGRNYLVFEIDIGFSSGRIRIGNGIYEEYMSEKSPYYEKFNSLKKIDVTGTKNGIWPDGPTGYFANMLEDAVLSIRNKKREPVSSAVHGYLALAFIDSLSHKS